MTNLEYLWIILVDGGILVFWEDQIFESSSSSSIMVPLKIATPTPAPDRGSLVFFGDGFFIQWDPFLMDSIGRHDK